MHKTVHEMSTRTLLRKTAGWVTCFFAAVIFLAPPGLCAVSDYAGLYSGTFSGGDSGIWISIIQSGGSAAFISWSYSLHQTDGTDGLSINDSGDISGWTENGAYLDIDVDSSSGTVTGTWAGGGNNGSLQGSQCDATALSALAGTYTGSISGDASGSFSVTAASSGYVSGSITVEGDTIPVEGGFDCDGNIILDASGEAGIKGTVFSNGSISGSWYSYDGYTGSFSGSSSGGGTSVDGDGGSGSGGPCFIQMIAD